MVGVQEHVRAGDVEGKRGGQRQKSWEGGEGGG